MEEGEGLGTSTVMNLSKLAEDSKPLVEVEARGVQGRENGSKEGCEFGSSSDQLFHLVSELQEGGGGEKGVWRAE